MIDERVACHSTATMATLRGPVVGLVPEELALAARHLPAAPSAEIDGGLCRTGHLYVFNRQPGWLMAGHTWWCPTMTSSHGVLAREVRKDCGRGITVFLGVPAPARLPS